MSLSIHNHDLSNYGNELYECIKIIPDAVKIIHWVTYRILTEYPNLEFFDDIPCSAFKVHEYQNGWPSGKKSIVRILNIARERNIPVMIHTGGNKESNSSAYLNICRKFKDSIIILAHGSPIHETIEVMTECENVYVDTAFMPVNDLQLLIENKFENRIIFGSDYPINRYFIPEKNDTDWYLENINLYVKMIGTEMFSKISNENFIKVFGS